MFTHVLHKPPLRCTTHHTTAPLAMHFLFLFTVLVCLLPLLALLPANGPDNPIRIRPRLACCPRLSTASSQFSYLNTIPAALFFTNRRTDRLLGLRHTIFTILLCLSGTIEPNPGPAFSLCSLNIRSLNADHSLYLNDILSDHHSDLVALSETWHFHHQTHSFGTHLSHASRLRTHKLSTRLQSWRRRSFPRSPTAILLLRNALLRLLRGNHSHRTTTWN